MQRVTSACLRQRLLAAASIAALAAVPFLAAESLGIDLPIVKSAAAQSAGGQHGKSGQGAGSQKGSGSGIGQGQRSGSGASKGGGGGGGGVEDKALRGDSGTASPGASGSGSDRSSSAGSGSKAGTGGGGGETEADSDKPSWAGTPGSKSGVAGGGGETSDSDRPAWAGVKGGKAGAGTKPGGAGTKKGDLYGNLNVVVRDPNGVPILVDGYQQTLAFTTDAAGNLVPLIVDGKQVVIPRDSEGNLLTTVTIGTTTYNVVPSTVDFGRTSVARSPAQVLDKSLTAVNDKLAAGTVVTLDASGRLVVDGTAIDSPLENLAIYTALMNPSAMTGTLNTSKLPANLNPAALLAAAADKTGTISVDYVVDLNSILNINTVTNGVTTAYYDFSNYNYDRAATWSTRTADVLVLQPDGSYRATTVNLYDTVFKSTNWTDPTASGGADDFAKAADDSLQVIEFIHSNAIPVAPTEE